MEREISFLQNVQIGPGARPASCFMGNCVLSFGGEGGGALFCPFAFMQYRDLETFFIHIKYYLKNEDVFSTCRLVVILWNAYYNIQYLRSPNYV